MMTNHGLMTKGKDPLLIPRVTSVNTISFIVLLVQPTKYAY